ncbi:HNH endonuclease [Streptomyces phage Forrest]|nr:HNH endonuclease [Streptomyces phage Forrest]
MKTRTCRYQACGREFDVVTRGDANRQYCSKECSKNATAKRVKTWNEENLTTEKNREYRNRYMEKNGIKSSDKWRKERVEILAALGGACEVCGVTKAVWLHVDYKPTCRNSQYRHPRHKAYVLANLEKFRILCANHHYELTLTGMIEGSDITQ